MHHALFCVCQQGFVKRGSVCVCRMQEVNQHWFQSEFIKNNVNKVGLLTQLLQLLSCLPQKR